MGRYIFKTRCGQRISPPEIDPNPNRARTVAGISRNVENEMTTPGLVRGWLGCDSVRAHGISLSRPRKTRNLKTWDSAPRATCSRLARSGVVRAGMGVGKPRAKRLEKLRIWWPGAASRAGAQRALREIPGVGRGRGGRISEFQFLKERSAPG